MSKIPIVLVGIGGGFAVWAGLAHADAIAFGMSAVSILFFGGGLIGLIVQGKNKVLSTRAQTARRIESLETRLLATHEELDSAASELARLQAERDFDDQLQRRPGTT